MSAISVFLFFSHFFIHRPLEANCCCSSLCMEVSWANTWFVIVMVIVYVHTSGIYVCDDNCYVFAVMSQPYMYTFSVFLVDTPFTSGPSTTQLPFSSPKLFEMGKSIGTIACCACETLYSSCSACVWSCVLYNNIHSCCNAITFQNLLCIIIVAQMFPVQVLCWLSHAVDHIQLWP